jgi:hypothetical protein
VRWQPIKREETAIEAKIEHRNFLGIMDFKVDVDRHAIPLVDNAWSFLTVFLRIFGATTFMACLPPWKFAL